MSKIIVLLAAVFMFGCSTTTPQRKVSSDGSPTVLTVKSAFKIEPDKKYTIKKSQLAEFKLPNGVVCYLHSKAKTTTLFNVDDKIDVVNIVVNKQTNGTTFDMGIFNLVCTESIVAWNKNPSFEKIQSELSDFATFD